MAEQKTYEHKLTKEQFYSQPLAAFINDNNESNYDIAKSIVSFFEDRDDGKYSAIVSDKRPFCNTWNEQEKYRYVKHCRGKYIIVWKQTPKAKITDDEIKESTVGSVVKALINDINDTKKINVILSEIFGNYWTVCCEGSVHCTYSQYYIQYKKWTVWRHHCA